MPTYPEEAFSHAHFINYMMKKWSHKYIIALDIEMNNQIKALYPVEMKNGIKDNILNYAICAICEE